MKRLGILVCAGILCLMASNVEALKQIRNDFTGMRQYVLKELDELGVTNYTLGSVLFIGATSVAEDNANLFWDDSNNRIGVGTNSPTVRLDVNGDIKIASANILYFGAIDTDGSWRIVRSGNDLVFERRESSSWVEKGAMIP